MSQVSENLRGFLSRVESLNRKGGEDPLGKEFQDIKTQAAVFRQDNNYSTEVGGSLENQRKNRYKDILPYDQTRVPVTLLAEEVGSDYINASFIQGIDSHPRYIATQGPLSHTVQDFWRMIWQYQVKVIVMACREVELGKKKCERYWPLDDGAAQFGPFTISTIEKIRVNAEVWYQNLRVNFQEEVREVGHFQYVAWPDRGIPDSYTCFLEMIQLVRQQQGEEKAPICVHCSAGCGRTGVICTVEYILSMLYKQRVSTDFSIFEIVLQMRCQRPSAVQTKEQYEFLYHAVTEMFEKQLQMNPNYENLNVVRWQGEQVQTNQEKSPFYDDATSTLPGTQPLTQQKRELSIRVSLPPDHKSSSVLDQSQRPLSVMSVSDTYAVIRKNRPAPPGTPSGAQSQPCLPDTRQASTLHQYDNLNSHTTTSLASVDKMYSIVATKSNRATAPAGLSLTQGPISSSYVLAGKPSSTDNSSAEYAQVPVSRTASFPDDYEDVTNPSNGLMSTGTPSGGIGFNCRIGKPKGPRDPPAEWSR
ncbi:tyrosine-protein phosphatase non-receptor type 18 [Rhinophrynus dorsalis]